MNDITVKIVETPCNSSGDVPVPLSADGGHHNEVDPLAFDDTDVLDVKRPVDSETDNEDNELNHLEVKVERCEENAKEKIETVPDASEKVKVLNTCETVKEELLKHGTGSLESSIGTFYKADHNNEQLPSSNETLMETEDSLPETMADLLTASSSEKTEISRENNTVKALIPKIEDNIVKEKLEYKPITTVKELTKEESLLEHISEIKPPTTFAQDTVPKDCPPREKTPSTKEIVKQETVNSGPEVHPNKVIPLAPTPVTVPLPDDISVKERNLAKEIIKLQEVVSQKEVVKIVDVIKLKPESKLKEVVQTKPVTPAKREPIKEKSPIREVITLATDAPRFKDTARSTIPEQANTTVNVKDSDVEMLAVKETLHSDVKKEKLVEAAKPERQPVNGDIAKEEQPSKRRASEEVESDSPLKKLCQEVEKTFPQHDTMINEFIQTTTKNSIDEIQRHTEQLLSEIQTLRELAQKKEHEWNNILHLKKVKEEILLRLLRRKQVLSFEKSVEVQNGSSCKDPFDYLNQAKNLAIDKSDEISGLVLKQPTPPANVNNSPIIQPPVLPVPVTSHFNPMSGLPPPYDKAAHMQSMSKPVFPQSLMMPGPTMPFPRDMNGQMTNFGLPMGRQGPTKDVKSIIADYRQRNPDVTPRRGRRMKSILNPNMMNQPRQLAPKMDNLNNLNNLGMIFNNLDMNQKAMLERLSQMQATSLPNGMSFKDVLVQYATIQQQSAGLVPPAPARTDHMAHSRPESHHPRPEPPGRRRERPPQPPPHEEAHGSMKQSERLATSSPRLPPPPPYPEISLLPVSSQDSGQPQNSLLHGILTKQAAPSAQSYSPTLAKLLTSPERRQGAPPPPAFGQAKNCGEITITPVQPTPPPPDAQTDKPEEVVQLDEEESPRSEGSAEDCAEGASGGGRLVIDEGGAAAAAAEGGEAPLCQGCRRRDAQFVCAGCANQWYCSRDCQVAAWDEHSDMCSG